VTAPAAATVVRISLDGRGLERLGGAIAGVREGAVFRVDGAGALACLQGIFSNDLEAPGPGSLVYGAFLSPKGMILADAWILRDADAFRVFLPLAAREAAAGIFQRSLPPRLARAHDETGSWAAAWLGGSRGRAVLEGWLGPDAPPAGRLHARPDGLHVGAADSPFAALIAGPSGSVGTALRELEAAGAAPAEEGELEAVRILAGWPALGAEIDAKTLPQEVRFDDLDGLSYAKGCYVGQETVARLHFRGHANRELRGLEWEGTAPDEFELFHAGRPVGRIRSLLLLPGRTLGLAPVRREVGIGATVEAGGQEGRVVALPFEAG
jgi:folate-binding protein YgfZ